MLRADPRCDKDEELHELWGAVSTPYRNLVTGVIELFSAPPVLLRKMAEIYEAPCPGRPAQPEAAKSLRSLAGGPRHIWIYMPG
jgi:hypothetical protein